MSHNMSGACFCLCSKRVKKKVYEVTTRSRPYARSGLDDLANVRSVLVARSSESTSPFSLVRFRTSDCSYCDRLLLYPV